MLEWFLCSFKHFSSVHRQQNIHGMIYKAAIIQQLEQEHLFRMPALYTHRMLKEHHT